MSLEKLVELVKSNKETTEEELAGKIWESGLMIPVDKHLNEVKGYKEKLATTKETNDSELAKELEKVRLELYETKFNQASDTEKKEMEIERLQTLVKDSALKENRLEARTKFLKAGWEDGDKVDSFIDTFVTDDALKSAQAVDLFLETVGKEKAELKQKVEEDIIHNTQKVDEGNTPETPDKGDDIDALVDELLDLEY